MTPTAMHHRMSGACRNVRLVCGVMSSLYYTPRVWRERVGGRRPDKRFGSTVAIVQILASRSFEIRDARERSSPNAMTIDFSKGGLNLIEPT